MIYAAIVGMTISFIPSFLDLKSFSIGYYFCAITLLFMALWLLCKNLLKGTIILFILVVDATILCFCIVNGHLNNSDLYFFPTLMGMVFFLQRDKLLLILCTLFTLICWIWLDLYGYALNPSPLFNSFEEVQTYRLFNLMGTILVSIIFGWLLNMSQREYEKKLEESKKSLQSALDFKTKLLRELHHRIKNNLNMISNLMFLKSKGMKNEVLSDFVKETNMKIISISKIHEQLLQMEVVENIKLGNYILDLINEIITSYTQDPSDYLVESNIEEITLDMDKTVTLGLIVNEVISNIIKHAYPEKQKAPIVCDIYSKDVSTISVKIGDFGQGMSDKNPSKSVGIQLIGALVESLEGEIQIETETGVIYHIDFPRS